MLFTAATYNNDISGLLTEHDTTPLLELTNFRDRNMTSSSWSLREEVSGPCCVCITKQNFLEARVFIPRIPFAIPLRTLSDGRTIRLVGWPRGVRRCHKKPKLKQCQQPEQLLFFTLTCQLMAQIWGDGQCSERSIYRDENESYRSGSRVKKVVRPPLSKTDVTETS